jgi:putative restriction endonuclease
LSGFEDAACTFRFDQLDSDARIRAAAFAEVQRLTQAYGNLNSKHLAAGFLYEGARIPFVNPRRGIFRPRQMKHLLSIKTVIPKPDHHVWYDDQREVHNQIFSGNESVDYAFMGTNPDAADNRRLREAMDFQVPIIYF